MASPRGAGKGYVMGGYYVSFQTRPAQGPDGEVKKKKEYEKHHAVIEIKTPINKKGQKTA